MIANRREPAHLALQIHFLCALCVSAVQFCLFAKF